MVQKRGESAFGEGASPGKIFIGGLARDTSIEAFIKYFGNYGEITDSVILKDRLTGRPRGFGFITYADPSVVDKVMEDTHVINGKQVEIKRTIPKGSHSIRTKKIFVGGIPVSFTNDDFKEFFSNYGKVTEHEIIFDHESKRSRGFGFVTFDSEHAVDKVLENGNMVDMAGTQVEIKKAEPKRSSAPSSGPSYDSYDRPNPYTNGYGGFGYMGSGGGAPFGGPGPYRSYGGGYTNNRFAGGGYGGNMYGGGGYGGYGGGGGRGYGGGGAAVNEFGGGYRSGGGYGGGYGGDVPFGNGNQFGAYGGGMVGGGGGGRGHSGGQPGYGSGQFEEPSPSGAGFGGGSAGYYGGGRAASRYNPYAR